MMRTNSNNLIELKRVGRVVAIAMCMVSTLAVLGAVSSQDVPKPLKAAKPAPVMATARIIPARVVAVETSLPQLASFKTRDLIEDVAPSVVMAPAPAVAVSTAPRSRTVRMEVTAYCACIKCCGPNAQGLTASGKHVSYNDGKFVAADTRVLPFGKRIMVPGYAEGKPVEVIDRGGAIKGNKLDLYFATHTDALVWGRQQLDVTIYD